MFSCENAALKDMRYMFSILSSCVYEIAATEMCGFSVWGILMIEMEYYFHGFISKDKKVIEVICHLHRRDQSEGVWA